MKAEFKLGGIIILLVLIWCWTKSSEKQDKHFLFNVEALANGEGGNVGCLFTGSVDCPVNKVKVYLAY